MLTKSLNSTDPSFSPIWAQRRSALWKIFAVVIGILCLILSSYIEVPMIPVPMTMQTYAVLVIGALFGWRLGAATVLAWLSLAALGLPLLSGSNGGLQAFTGPTAGYLFAFVLAAALTGWLAQQGWNAKRPVLAFSAMLLAHAVCLLFGALWLATKIGLEPAITGGVTPFLIGAIVKSALAVATLKALDWAITNK